MLDEKWLKDINDDFRRKNIPPKKRPFEALSRLSQDKNITIPLNSPQAQAIFSWFEKNSKPGAHMLGALYESCYFYDATFWKVVIPVVYGTCKLDAFDALPEIPESIKNSLTSNRPSQLNYIIFWSDCVDFAFGYDDMIKINQENTFGLEMLRAAYEELQSSKSLLEFL